MEVRRLTEEEIKHVYRNYLVKDFPPEESSPWIFIKKLLEKETYSGYGLFEGAKLLGYAFFQKWVIDEKVCYLLDFLAILKEFRNRKLGSEFLQLLTNGIQNAECVLVEVEDPEWAKKETERSLQERRIGFYQRSGFYTTGVKVRVRGVYYQLMEMSVGPQHTDEQIRNIYHTIYTLSTPKWFMKTQFCFLD